MIFVRSNNQSLKYKKFTSEGCKDIYVLENMSSCHRLNNFNGKQEEIKRIEYYFVRSQTL